MEQATCMSQLMSQCTGARVELIDRVAAGGVDVVEVDHDGEALFEFLDARTRREGVGSAE